MTAFDDFERLAWAGTAAAYARTFGKLCAHPVPLLLDVLRLSRNERLLDVGTGTGTLASAAIARGAEVTAVDAEPGMAAFASRNVPEAHVSVAALPVLPFRDDEFDAVAGNFVLNHCGRPRAALAELRRVTRPGGRIAVSIWATPAGAGQTLLGRAVEAAGARRPSHVQALAAEDDFERSEQGLAGLLLGAGMTEVHSRTVAWDHHTTAEEWWGGPAAGIAAIGQTVVSQTPETVAQIRRHYDRFSAEFTGPEGGLVLPHRALIAHGDA